MPLHCEAALRFSSSFHDTTYTRTGGFCFQQIPDSAPGGTQDPPVLLTLEKVCSVRPPLSSVSGRQRYNTLDFARKVVCHETSGFIGFFLPGRRCPPLDSTRQGSSAAFGNHCQGYAVPFGIPCQQDAPRPYWMTQGQKNCRPFGFPARFEMSTHKGKMVCWHSFQKGSQKNCVGKRIANCAPMLVLSQFRDIPWAIVAALCLSARLEYETTFVNLD